MPPSEISDRRKLAIPRLMNTDQAAPGKPSRISSKQHPWKVVHACELAREVWALVEGQSAVGMRPFLLTPGGFGAASTFLELKKREGPPPISLLQTWSHVREWRRLLNDSGVETSAEVIHAHSFSAGMAAVRASSGVVYQFKQTVEKLAASAGHCDESSWLARSFRVAEQFVLTRAAAVVVNNHAKRLACLERGVGAESVFLIPEPVSSELLESTPDRKWLQEVAGGGPETVFVLIPGMSASSGWESRDALLRWMRVLSVVRHEHEDVKFVFLGESDAAAAVEQMASACNLVRWVKVLDSEMSDKALASADIVICGREHASSRVALETLARGRALLAADVEQHRDITADGRGCLWYRAGEIADIAQRASFLAGNSQFRRALAAAGREHCLATRSAEVVGAQYDAVYRLAFSRRKGRDTSTPKAQLIPLQVS